MSAMELPANLEQLAQFRNILSRLQEKETEAIEALHKTEEYITVNARSNAVREMKKKIGELETEIKELEVESAKKYKGYLPPPGITIKNFKVLKVTDEKEAKVWMALNAPTLLSFNDGKLLKAVEHLEVDFATVEEEPRAQIASNLNKYLENENEN